MRGWVKSSLIALVAVAITSVFFIDFCNLVFQCGCTHLWAGADAKCNIHNHSGAHCPWCSFGPTGGYAVYTAMVIPQALLAFLPRGRKWQHRLAASLAVFPVAGSILAVVLGLATGYWS